MTTTLLQKTTTQILPLGSPRRWPTPALGVLALALYSVHGGYHLSEGHPEQLLWACHVGNMAVGLGLIARRRGMTAVGVLILAVGLPLWFTNLFFGGRFIVTSPLMHVGGLAIGLWGVTRLGLPQNDKWTALGTLAVLVSLSRLLTPPASNINLAFYGMGPTAALPIPPQLYLVCLLVHWLVLLTLAEWIVRRVMRSWTERGQVRFGSAEPA